MGKPTLCSAIIHLFLLELGKVIKWAKKPRALGGDIVLLVSLDPVHLKLEHARNTWSKTPKLHFSDLPKLCVLRLWFSKSLSIVALSLEFVSGENAASLHKDQIVFPVPNRARETRTSAFFF